MQVTFQGKPVNTVGALPSVGSNAPELTLVKTDLSLIHLKDLKGQNVILNIFISIDTSVCALSVRKFNEEAAKLPNTTILCVSMDLPFAHKRFCAAEHLEKVIPVSAFRNPEFGKNYGVTISEGPLSQLLSRAIVIIDPKGKILYTEQVAEITDEPNYQAALDATLLHS